MGLEHLILSLLKTPRGRATVASLLTATGVLWVWLLVPSAIASRRLADHHATATAQVIDSRISHGLHLDKSHGIRYRFKVPGDRRWFYQSDHTGRTELWATLPKADWKPTVDRGTVDVIYLPDDPTNNALATKAPSLRRTATAMLAWSLAWCGAGALWLSFCLARRIWTGYWGRAPRDVATTKFSPM